MYTIHRVSQQYDSDVAGQTQNWSWAMDQRLVGCLQSKYIYWLLLSISHPGSVKGDGASAVRVGSNQCEIAYLVL